MSVLDDLDYADYVARGYAASVAAVQVWSAEVNWFQHANLVVVIGAIPDLP